MKRGLFLIVGCFLMVCLAAWAMSMSTDEASGYRQKRQVFVGVFREGAPANINHIKKYEEQTGNKPAMIMWYQDWDQNFPQAAAMNAVKYGAVPHIVWEPWYWSDHSKVQLKDIIAGKWDNYIRTWAQEIRSFKHVIFLRVGHEFNIEGYPWGIINNEKNPEIYIKAYRRVVDIFKKEKVKNVRWVWCFMNYSYPKKTWNDWVAAYPGDEYVDWIGIDGYNWGTTQDWSDWQGFHILFRDQTRRAKKLWPDKPIMVAEFGSAEKGGDKAAWIKEIPTYLKTSMRDMDLIIWFDIKKETDWRIKSSKKSLVAFKEIMEDPIFSGSGEVLARLVVSAEKPAKKKAYAVKASGSVVIDGKLSDWDKSKPISMKDESYFKEGLDWEGVEDLSGFAYLMWDEENLYLAAVINDKDPLMNRKKKRDIWNGDGIEMFLSVKPKADPERSGFKRGDYQVGFGTGDGVDNPPAIWNWQRRRTPKGSEIAVKKTKEGYILEAMIPWKFFSNEFVPSKGIKLGFDLAFDDADVAGGRECQFIWNGDYYSYRDPSVWGILEFR